MLAALFMLLAEGDGAAKTAPPGTEMLPLLLIGVSFLIFIIMPMRRDKKQRTQMLATVDKGDKVVVSGAFLGTVTQIDKGDEKDPEDKLVLKIDDNSNLKMRVLRSSITRVYKKDSKDGA
ncbi:MAG TPA: preprotein translocase subunit YajC [Gemmataceae bacterium]|jgi:preprotein translocase subunit YajC|nr:preprotein translocase subunit YajC [Gemmataceae bacterium]